MYRVLLPAQGFAPVWRNAARRLLSHGISPDAVLWQREGPPADLFAAVPLPDSDGDRRVIAPAAFPKLAETVLCHGDPGAPSLLYETLFRHQSDPHAHANPADHLARRIDKLAKSVRRDIHKMHAFVRFREVPGNGPRRRFGAWFEPDHHILEAATPFFARRFADMDWTIATPVGTARFEDGKLSFHPPAARPDLPEDASETLWATYFTNIFNPARLHLQAMRSEMPLKYWKNMPETDLIPTMLATAEARVAAMRAAMPTAAPVRAERILGRLAPEPGDAAPATLDEAEKAAARCRRCDLCEAATQTVWGEGDRAHGLMIVGEQPGNDEDLAGRPFVGPAGRLLRTLLQEAGVEPGWMTNAVKHFKFRPRGKRRLHQPAGHREIDHCRWWLDLERKLIAPRLSVALGASAAYALTGNAGPLRARRGRVEAARDGGPVLVTWHPSYILRLPPDIRGTARGELLGDLLRVPALLAVAP